jgi:ligand-binding SRPBCC domain-containing protein
MTHPIRWAGLPIRWQTRIIDWSPPHHFVDLQLRGPYAMWHHRHTFTPVPDGTLCHDQVLYRLPLGPLGRLTHALLVRRQLLTIFRHRRQVIGQHLGWIRDVQDDVTIRPAG